MNYHFFRSCSLTLLLVLAACQPTPTSPEYKETFVTFGTLVEINLITPDKQQAAAVMERLHKDLDYLDYSLHAWHAGSLGRINQLMEATGEFSANPSVIPLLTKARALSIESEELFNPAIGQLIKLWGYQSDELPKGPPPTAQAIQELLSRHPSMQDFSINGVRFKNSNAAIRFDLGAIAKGYAAEKLAERLRQYGFHNALISVAGDIKALGKNGDRKWHIGIKHPRQDGVIASLTLEDNEVISTSGDYERFYEFEGKRFHHLIDPRTGYPAATCQSVTVISNEGERADAAATALFIAGPEHFARIASSMNIKFVLLIDAKGDAYVTRAMSTRLKFSATPPARIHIIDAS